MATSIASQLAAIKSHVQADSDPLKRPFTRPSILYDPKQAADISIETIWDIANQGLELLISTDERFRNYKNDLFSHRSKELDRELMGREENNQINVSIASYLRLLSGYFLLPSASSTLEYLIRRYKIHVYNTENLILCALPYHDTHKFVRIVQILEIRNAKWGFLDGVKVSGASLPRNVIVQQCIRDNGILEDLCNYASPSKKFHPSKHVISFCTAVFIEVLGTVVTVSNDLVKRILHFVFSGLQPGIRGVSDHKAGSLMIVGLLGNKVTLAPKLLNSLIRSIAEVARKEAKEMNDLQWFRLSLVALINLVQSQKVDILPKKAVEILKEIRDLAGILFELSMEFDIERFLFVLLDSLIDYCSSDVYCQQALVSIIEKVPLKNSIHHVVAKILSTCLKLSQKVADPLSSISGVWAKKILIVINKMYPSELRRSVHHFLEDNQVCSKKDDSIYKILCKMLDGNLDSSSDISDSKIWFALHHPKADVRRSILADLSSSGILKSKLAVTESERLIDIQEALLRQLDDRDLTVVQAALSVEGLANVIGSSELLDALENVLKRCIDKLISGSAASISQTCEVAITCLRNAISYFHGDTYIRRIAAMIFPLLLVLPQTQSLNIKALGLVNEINWSLYQNLSVAPNGEVALMSGSLSSFNFKTINIMAENLIIHLEDHIAWFVESCSYLELSKTLFFLVLLQSLLIKPNSDDFSVIFESVFPILRSEWDSLVSAGDFSVEEFNSEVLDWDCTAFFNHLSQISLRTLNAKVMVCIFWRMLSALLSALPSDILLDNNDKWSTRIKDLFVFFAASQFKHAFREHLHYLAAQCRISPPRLLSKFFTEEGVPVSVQVESLQCFAFLCSLSQDRWQVELLAEFPSVLVPLASDNRDIRMAALNCIDGLRALWSYIERSGKKNGSNATWSHFVGEFLGLIDQQKTLILSDKKFLPSLFASMLSPSYHDILVLQNIENRFDQSTKEKILAFILGSALKLSDYGKLMILSLLKGVGNSIMHVKGVEALFSQLTSKHSQYYNQRDKSCQKLSNVEVQILCLLLESCVMSSSSGGNDYKCHLLKALQMGIRAPEDPAHVQPYITVLNLLNRQFYMGLKNEVKEQLFCELVLLCRNANGKIQSATRDALLRIDISCSTVGHVFDLVFKQENHIIGSVCGKKKKKLAAQQEADLPLDDICRRENSGYILSSLLDVLLLKKDMQNRHLLIDPLFKLLSKIFSEEWVNGTLSRENDLVQSSSNISDANTSTLGHIQHTLLIILEDIVMSLQSSAPVKDEITNEINVKLLVECARFSKDAVTRNHVFSLLSAVTKVFPEKVSAYILDIVAIIGESVVTQIDSHSKHVFEDLISAIVPCWLSKSDNVEDLLKIFMDLLPDIVEHKKLSIVLYLLRNLGEGKSLASLLVLLFRSLVSRRRSSFLDSQSLDALLFYTREWEYKFAVQICEQYRSMTWLPSLVQLFQQMGNDNFDQGLFLELFLAVQFTVDKLQDPEFVFKLESGEDADALQLALEELMGQAVFLLQLVDARRRQLNVPLIVRKEFKETVHTLLRNITMAMIPSTYFTSIMKLLGHADKNVGKKALGLLCETARNHMIVSSKHKESKGLSTNTHSPWLHMNKSSQESLNEMCSEIVQIIDDPVDDSNASLIVAAISALEVLANSFPSNTSIFNVCLGSVTRGIISNNSAVSSSCLRTTASLINVLRLGALAELPHIMENVMIKAKSSDAAPSSSNETLMLPVLTALEAVVDKLGGFLNPFLKNIVELLVLHPEYVLARDAKVESRAHRVRRLLAEKIPVRLALPPVLQAYLGAVEVGDNSLAVVFDMLATLVGTMDRSSIVAFHVKIFDLCLLALDLRCQCPVSVQNINAVEKGVINAMIALTKKLTESMFKPLFIKSIEWAESSVDKTESMPSIDRAISFYGMVNKLAENHRSLFVPYFKHLLASCVQHLSDVGNAKVSCLSRKKKKAKIQDEDNAKEAGSVSIKGWHLRTLVLSSLHKCFLYDTGASKFLDSSNFQMLLKPIVSQLVVDPPTCLDDNPNVSSVKEVDDLLVICIGQMAVTAGTDLLWKPLNHEVLMQTRSEKLRARILGLRTVKYLVDNLKEEYLVFLAETIPFLAELLEDVELSVKTLAQEILQEMESLSGESLRQYL